MPQLIVRRARGTAKVGCAQADIIMVSCLGHVLIIQTRALCGRCSMLCMDKRNVHPYLPPPAPFVTRQLTAQVIGGLRDDCERVRYRCPCANKAADFPPHRCRHLKDKRRPELRLRSNLRGHVTVLILPLSMPPITKKRKGW
jgi:hypothetical protein